MLAMAPTPRIPYPAQDITMKPVEKNRKECYEEPLLEIVEWEGAGIVCQSGDITIDPDFEEEITIPLG